MKREFIFLLTSLMLIGLLGTASMSQEAGTWTQKADMPTARFVSGSAVVDGKIYIIGGESSLDRIAVVEEYDPAADTWTTIVEGIGLNLHLDNVKLGVGLRDSAIDT
jgi:hypothetical protein